ncbi:MPT synthase subunit 2 [Desulfovibrionales bacterium]
MDILQTIIRLKKEPEFIFRVGMILVHNGVVRAWSRKEGTPRVEAVEITQDRDRIEALRCEYEQQIGIYRIIVEAASGRLVPGDDLLFILVAGDVREHVKPVLSELLDRIKAEAVVKREILF